MTRRPAPDASRATCAVVIEDDPEIRSLHRQVLDQLGLRVVMTTNAADGIEAVREFDPDITFLDVTMPGMDGFAAAARIRALSSTHILMITALDDEIDVVQGLGAGADDYVPKPFRPRELRARVEAILRRRRTAEAGTNDALAAAPVVLAPREPDPDLGSPADSGAPRAVLALERTRERPQSQRDSRAQGRTEAASHPRSATAVAVSVPDPVHDHDHDLAQLAATAGANALSVVPAQGWAVRHAGISDRPAVEQGEWLRHGTLSLRRGTSQASVDGVQVDLEDQEAVLLATLLASGTRIRSVANLVLALRGEGYVTTYFVNDADKRAVVDHVDSLRRKLGDIGPTPLWIEPVRAVGFRMTSG